MGSNPTDINRIEDILETYFDTPAFIAICKSAEKKDVKVHVIAIWPTLIFIALHIFSNTCRAKAPPQLLTYFPYAKIMYAIFLSEKVSEIARPNFFLSSFIDILGWF